MEFTEIILHYMNLNDYMYFTGIASINHYGCDWHRTTVDYNCVFPKEVRNWTDYGIYGNKANPIRAYLDYLYYNIKFLGRVPNMKIDMFGFSEQQEREIKEKIESLLKPALSEELELFKLYKQYLNGGKYDFRSKSYIERKTRREALKKLNAIENRTVARDFYDFGFILEQKSDELSQKTKERISKKFQETDLLDLAILYESSFKEDLRSIIHQKNKRTRNQ